MCDFLAVVLHENLRFSSDYMNQFTNKIGKIINNESDYTETTTYENVMIGLKESKQKIFTFENDRYSIVFHGKVYNEAELKHQLQCLGYHFKTRLTCEVIAYLFLEKGVKSFEEIRGMFVILIWDNIQKRIYGARDRFGIKRLYYMENNERTIFATDKNIILSLNDRTYMNYEAVQQYLTFQHIPEPMTINKGIYTIKPGHYFIKNIHQPIQSYQYFHAKLNPMTTEKNQLKGKIREALCNSIEKQVKNEKSLGLLLSGGIDSSLIAAIAKEYYPNLKTFSVGFNVDGFSELDEAKQTAEILGLENRSIQITPEEFKKKLPEIMLHLGEPFANLSCIPLYFITQEAKKHVTTVLSGEGADELFGGYHIYQESKLLNLFNYLPRHINNSLYKLSILLPEGLKGKNFLKRGTTPIEERYTCSAKIFEENEKQHIFKIYNDNIAYQSVTKDLFQHVKGENKVQKMQYVDIHTWLPGDILFKAERMTKAHSLELRVPFLDQEVFEIAKTIPAHEKVAKGTTKLILREAFRDFLPNEVVNRKKLGFPVPVSQWLKNELYDWAKQIVYDSGTDYIFDKRHIIDLLERHASHHKSNDGRKIWTVLMFMLWHQVYIEDEHECKYQVFS